MNVDGIGNQRTIRTFAAPSSTMAASALPPPLHMQNGQGIHAADAIVLLLTLLNAHELL
jgi:hypothetical protein